MARNEKNAAACDQLAAAISKVRREGAVTIQDDKLLLSAYSALLAAPGPCRDDCKHRLVRQRCQVCARNYRNLKDNYERL